MNELTCRVGVMALGFALGAFEIAAGQVKTTAPAVVAGARPAIIEGITIRGKAIEGSLEGNTVDRAVLVFLPPRYRRERNRRYPVMHALHGYSIGAEQWAQEVHVPQTIEGRSHVARASRSSCCPTPRPGTADRCTRAR